MSGMTTASFIALGIAAAGTAMSMYGQSQAAKAQKQEAAFQQEQFNTQAGQARASAQRSAMEERRQASLVQSKAVAGLAANGGTATDPTALDLTSDIEGEGEYRALTALYTGENRARGLEDQGNAVVFSAKNKAQAGKIQGYSTALSNASSMFGKFGGAGASPIGPSMGPVQSPSLSMQPGWGGYG